MLEMTQVAVAKFLEAFNKEDPRPGGLRVGIVGGGCSGFSYQLKFEEKATPKDKVVKFNKKGETPKSGEPEEKDGEVIVLRVLVDPMSAMYLDNTRIDYVESLEGAGFKFNNPSVKSTCGCGSSFSA